MEINPPVTTNSSLPIPNPKSPDSDPNPIDQLPSTRIHSTKPTILTNGVLKRHTSPTNTTYKECRKNHAASIGGHALDGCGEFMPSPNSTPTDPTSLTCAACGCHRNFHRRDPDDSCTPTSTTTHVIEYHPQHRHHPLPPPPPSHHRARSPNNSPSPPPISSSYYPPPLHSHSAPHMLLALSEGGGGGNPHHHHPYRSPNLTPRNCNSEGRRSRKRFRTKFTQDQKDRMYEFAEKVGWKMQRSNDEMVAGFCNEVGVERGVLKVWMHNNKNTYGGKRDLNLMISSSNNNINLVSSSSGGGGGGVATNLVGRSGVGGGIQLQPLLNHHLHQQNGNEDVSNSTDQSSGRENNNVGGNSSGIANSYSKNGVIHHSSNNNDGGGGGTNGSSSSS